MADLMMVQNVHAAYSVGKLETTAVEGVSLNLREGEVLGLAGEAAAANLRWRLFWP